MASSTDDNVPDSTVQEVKISTDDDQSEKTGDTEFFDVAEGSPKSQLTPGLPEVAEASEADIETSSVMSNEEPSLQNNQSEGEAKDDVDTKSPAADPHLNDEGSTEEGLSVFSNGTSGQDFLRSVSNAKRSIDEIDKEIRELKGVSAPRENKVEAKTSGDKGEKAPIERNHDVNDVLTKVPREKESTNSATNRRMEPPTKKEQGASKQSSNDNKKKQRRKTTKKKQVHPKKEEHNGPIDPDGKVIPRTRYRKRGTERDTQSFSEVGNVDGTPNHKDPPMVIDGHLEPAEPTVEKNDNGKADSGKRKKKKKKKKKKDVSRGDIKHDRPSEDEDAELMNGVVSSRMDRGDDESVPVDEIHVDSEESDTYKSDDPHKEYDPWEEVPCSWCCRYLPHSLVVATTQAYRLDRADEKENELMIDSRH